MHDRGEKGKVINPQSEFNADEHEVLNDWKHFTPFIRHQEEVVAWKRGMHPHEHH